MALSFSATPETATDRRWQAVRDRAIDNSFVYAVSTTRIFCRSSCPSRRAKPEHVQFFSTAAEAEAAGYRPCLRCKPDGLSRAQIEADAVARACRMIEDAEDLPTLEALAAAVGISPFHFHRLFKRQTGLTPRAYGAARRAEKLRASLGESSTVTEAIYEAGFNASSRMYEQAHDILGMTPSAFRAGGKNARIRFAVGTCTLGHILVAQSSKGICAILLGDEPDLLLKELQDRFPKADLIGGDKDFEATIAAVVAFVDAPQLGLDLPLDVRGTAFQQRVWGVLREIPLGQTISYTELAARVGQPTAVRAVASACAANAIAVVIPCHRVVRTDGSLSGYRWGLERKQALIDREAASSNQRS
jgi:AraC family transcriptional regulator of adaptative response/methylated-DNA-[protein]-cysteine methyltransferase